MSESYLGYTLIYNFQQNLPNSSCIPLGIQNEEGTQKDDVQFCLNYQEFQCPKTRKRSEMISTIYHLKAKNKEKELPSLKKSQHRELVDPSMPKKISVNFDLFNPKKKRKEELNTSKSNKFEELFIQEKEKYMEKIDKQKKKKHEKCRMISTFGLNIKTIESTIDCKPSLKKAAKIRASFSRNQLMRRNSQNQTNIKIQPKHNKSLNRDLLLEREKNRMSLTNTMNPEIIVLRNRLQRMIDSNNMALLSYGCFLEDAGTRSGKLKYFVGNGNNRSVVVSILKKRWWWAQTSDPSTANLIWTQLRHKSTFERLELFDSESMPLAELQKSLIFEPFHPQKPKSKVKSTVFQEHMRSKFQFLLPDKDRKKLLMPLKTPECVHNHYSNNFAFGNKSALYHNLTTYFTFKQQNVYSIIPKTYFVDSIGSDKFQQFAAEGEAIKNAVWIVKPGENSNRGNGIFVARSVEQIKSRLSRKKPKHSYIIQKYITDLFLYQRRKFDIRTFMLTLTIRGVTKYYWYNQGYLRTSSELYDIKELSDFFIHLTNDAVQLKSDNYGKFEAGNKLSFGEFQHYLDSNYPEEKYSVKGLNKQMKEIATIAVKATYPKIDPQPKMYSFQIFGLDFIIDGNFKPWLIEVNTNPCLQLNSPVLQRILPEMLENTFRLAVDPVYQPFQDPSKLKNCYLYESCLERNRFQIMFDSLFDRDFEWQEHLINQRKLLEGSRNDFEVEVVQFSNSH